MKRTGSKGVVYLAFGYEYLLMAAHSARTAKESNPGIECELITNVRFEENLIKGGSGFDRVTFLDLKPEQNRYVKTSIVDYTDLEYAVYVDCDTEIKGSLAPAFSFLDKYDIAIKHCAKPTAKEYEVAPGIASQLFPEWNGGVVFFRNNERTRKFFRDWCDLFRAEGKNRDQPSLACTIYRSDWGGRLLSLNVVWNTFPGDVRRLRNGLKDSRIWHYRQPEYWPAVAPAILGTHRNFQEAVYSGAPSTREEIEEVDRRYRFLSSGIYRMFARHPRSRKAFSALVDVLMRRGLCARFRWERNHLVSGDAYREIERRAWPE